MGDQLQVIRGMHDILPADMPVWNHLEDEYRALVESYGYRQIRTPIIEKSALFARSIGEVTDIVEKEMYSFEDRNGDSLSLRPENTASVVRAGLQAGLLHDQQQRLWYYGPMFRHERPQKGRYRQFHQFGAETFGMSGADIEAELILLAARFWKRLGLRHIDFTRKSQAHLHRRHTDGDRRNESDPVVGDRQAANAAELSRVAEPGNAREDHRDDEWNHDHTDRIHENGAEWRRAFREREQPIVARGGGAEADDESEDETCSDREMQHLLTPSARYRVR